MRYRVVKCLLSKLGWVLEVRIEKLFRFVIRSKVYISYRVVQTVMLKERECTTVDIEKMCAARPRNGACYGLGS